MKAGFISVQLTPEQAAQLGLTTAAGLVAVESGDPPKDALRLLMRYRVAVVCYCIAPPVVSVGIVVGSLQSRSALFPGLFIAIPETAWVVAPNLVRRIVARPRECPLVLVAPPLALIQLVQDLQADGIQPDQYVLVERVLRPIWDSETVERPALPALLETPILPRWSFVEMLRIYLGGPRYDREE